MASSSNNPFGPPSNARARPSLPPPSQPSSSSNAAVLPSASWVWPFSDLNLLFYFDPFSEKVASFKTELEAHAALEGRPFPSTNLIERATHVVLDPDCNQNLPLRSLPLPQHVVTLQWLEDRTLRRTGYEFERSEAEEEVGEPEEELDELEEEEVDEAEVVSSQALSASDYVDARYASRGGWLKSEEEELARFLASDPQPDENYRSIWDQYRDEHPSRSASGYLKHYESRRDAYFDSKIAELNGKPLIFAGSSGRRVDDAEDSDVDSDDSQRLRARTAPSTLVARSSGEGRGLGTRIAWSRKEDADLVSLLSRRQGTKSEVWLALSAKHPRRTPHSVQQHYHRFSRRIDRHVEALLRGGRKQKKKTVIRSNFDDHSEDEEDSNDNARPLDDRGRTSEPRAISSKRRRVESSPPRNAVASSSKVTLDHHPHRHRHSLPSSSRPLALNSHPTRYQPRPSLPNPPPQHTQTQSRRPTSPLTSPSLSPALQRASAPPPPPPSNSNPAPSIRLPSPEVQNLEPPSFLAIGARPSTSSPHSNWCYFCGSDSQPQHTFASLALAGPKSLEDQEVIKAPERLACWTCAKVYRTRVVDGKKLAKGVKEMGELERLASVTVVLLEKGIAERNFRVYG